MPTPQALEALKILSANKGSQVMPSEAYGFAGDVPTQGELESPFELAHSRRAVEADARDREAVARIQATNAGVDEYNRPDVQAIRQQEEEDALKKLILPLQVKGQFDVEAAKQHAAAAASNTQALIGGRQQVADTNQGAVTARAQANLKSQALRQRYQAVATGKEKAPVGFFEGFVPGKAASAQQKLLADIQSQIDASDAGGGGEDMAEAPAAAAPTAPVSAAELLARRRARTAGR